MHAQPKSLGKQELGPGSSWSRLGAPGALTSHMDVSVGHEQHGQRVHLGRVPHEDAAVGLDGHEVGEPAAVELGRLPAGAAPSARPGRHSRCPVGPPPAHPPVDGGLVQQHGAGLGPVRVTVGLELPLARHLALSHLPWEGTVTTCSSSSPGSHGHPSDRGRRMMSLHSQELHGLAECVPGVTAPGSHPVPGKGQTTGGRCHLRQQTGEKCHSVAPRPSDKNPSMDPHKPGRPLLTSGDQGQHWSTGWSTGQKPGLDTHSQESTSISGTSALAGATRCDSNPRRAMAAPVPG